MQIEFEYELPLPTVALIESEKKMSYKGENKKWERRKVKYKSRTARRKIASLSNEVDPESTLPQYFIDLLGESNYSKQCDTNLYPNSC